MPNLQFDDTDGTLAILSKSVETFASRIGGAKVFRARRAAGADVDATTWSGMAEAGWLGLLLPESLGGAGLTIREQTVLCEGFGRALLCEPVAQLSVFSSSLLGYDKHTTEHARLASGICDGSLLVAPAWQGTDGRAAPVNARVEADKLVLDGQVHLVSAPVSATDFLVLARIDGGLALVSVPARTSGTTVETRPTIDGSLLGTVRFAQAKVPSGKIVARGDDVVEALFDNAIARTRLALAAELAGLASRALEITVAYTKTRVQFGKPIASFQVLQHRMVDMWGDAEFACAAVVNAAEHWQAGWGLRAELAVLAAKARAGDAAVSVTRRAIHLHGAMGFTDECDIGLYMKRATSLNATLGQPDELRLRFLALENAA